MRLIKMFLFVLPSVLIPKVFAATGKANVLVCYGRLNPETVKGYNVVILEQEHYKPSEIKKMKTQNDKVLAYISLGEVNRHAKHYPLLKGSTLGKNQLWDSYYLDLTAEKTKQVLMKIIGETIAMGYDGFFLDNFDNFGPWGKQTAQKAELVALLKNIYDKYPHYTFLQNAGIDLIAQTAPYVDGVVVESVATDYSFTEKKYQLRADADFQQRASRLADISTQYKLPVTLIEYAGTEAMRAAVEKKISATGFDYFIGQIDLQKIPQFTN